MRTAGSVFPLPGLDRLTKNHHQKTFANISQTEVCVASKELVLGVFGEQVFRNGYRLKQTTFTQSNKTIVYFNLVVYLCTQATCFGLWLGHPQACQFKNVTKVNTVRVLRGPFYFFTVTILSGPIFIFSQSLL
jgi:hypothetical protein